MKKILILCTGNICRSPMAEGLFADYFKQNNTISIQSAGIAALVGKAPELFAQEVMLEKKGIDISQHRAEQLTQTHLLQADIVFVMELRQKKQIEFKLPAVYGRVQRLGQWSNFDIPDPYRRSKKAFEQTYILLEQCLYDWQARI